MCNTLQYIVHICKNLILLTLFPSQTWVVPIPICMIFLEPLKKGYFCILSPKLGLLWCLSAKFGHPCHLKGHLRLWVHFRVKYVVFGFDSISPISFIFLHRNSQERFTQKWPKTVKIGENKSSKKYILRYGSTSQKIGISAILEKNICHLLHFLVVAKSCHKFNAVVK